MVGLSALQFGGVVVLGKLVAETRLPAATYLSIRFGISAVVLAAFLWGLGQPLAAARGERLPLVALGAVGYGIESGLFYFALGQGGAAIVTLLFFTFPVWILLMSLAAGRGLPGRMVIGALAATVAGTVLVTGAGGGLGITPIGMAAAFVSAVFYAAYLFGVELKVRRTDALTAAMWTTVTTAMAMTVAAGAGRAGPWPSSPREWGLIAGVGILSGGAFLTLFAGVRRIGALRTSIISSGELVVAAALAVVFLGESVTPTVVAGGLLILGGGIAASVARRPGRTAPEPPTP